mgnify:CR=1 FL=1
MEFKWQHTEWLYTAPLLLLVVIISAVFFQRWRHKVWRKGAVGVRSNAWQYLRSTIWVQDPQL